METTVKNYVYNTSELKKYIIVTIENIEKWAKDNNYRLKGDFNSFKISLMGNEKFITISKNKRKKINQYIFSLERKITMRNANSFLHFIYKTMNNNEPNSSIKIIISEKEEKIQMLRKQWLKMRNESDNLLKSYKDEKGDFYKKRLVKN